MKRRCVRRQNDEELKLSRLTKLYEEATHQIENDLTNKKTKTKTKTKTNTKAKTEGRERQECDSAGKQR